MRRGAHVAPTYLNVPFPDSFASAVWFPARARGRRSGLYSGLVPAPILATKLYIPASRRRVVLRPRLVERLDEGLAAGNKLALVSAPAGFGKTTLVGEWVAGCGRPAAWLSLDAGDSDPSRFLTYLVAALQTVAPGIGEGLMTVLQSPQAPPPTKATLTALLNDIATIPNDVVIVLDDYHVLDARPVDDALAFLVEHLPPQVHIVMATREDPALPLARLRARGQLTELRAADLRFTPSEAAAFLNQVMGLALTGEQIAALDTRTEGWIAGLQLAAISLQGRSDAASFIASFAGSHHFVLDYLVEEVLGRQPEPVQAFLLRTSILDRLCGPLCDAVLLDVSASSQGTLEYLDRANLFLVPLDTERRWYRYHHLFAELLRERRQQAAGSAADRDEATGRSENGVNGFKLRYVEGTTPGEFGVDYLSCGICNYYRRRGKFEYVKYLCLVDYAIMKNMGIAFSRTTTLGNNGPKCDFRFSKAGPIVEGWPASHLEEFQPHGAPGAHGAHGAPGAQRVEPVQAQERGI
jgi:hypothetical protein